ncbi:MAG: hypothetical protein AMJ62_14375 [Myxococcales bacterium SG8_38]|nr:MAG: hypothetical protein AMJ62_14375 [Myxococcales bacterium SG8_38]
MTSRTRKNEGAALFVVLMIIMVGTASAVFSASTVSYEVRGAGFARQQLQTRYAARAGLVGGLEWFDIFGPETVRSIMLTPGSTEGVQFSCVSGSGCYPEPPLANNRRAYRLYPQHYDALLSQDGGVTPGLLENVPVDPAYSFGPTSAHTPVVVVDIYDEHVVSTLAPGAAAQGGTKFKYMRSTLTARGRAQVSAVSDHAESEDLGREQNEAAADMRAYIVSGPFITGS